MSIPWKAEFGNIEPDANVFQLRPIQREFGQINVFMRFRDGGRLKAHAQRRAAAEAHGPCEKSAARAIIGRRDFAIRGSTAA